LNFWGEFKLFQAFLNECESIGIYSKSSCCSTRASLPKWVKGIDYFRMDVYNT
ncbi:unnamed protein product, partial [Rotaria sp. Silwood2]